MYNSDNHPENEDDIVNKELENFLKEIRQDNSLQQSLLDNLKLILGKKIFLISELVLSIENINKLIAMSQEKSTIDMLEAAKDSLLESSGILSCNLSNEISELIPMFNDNDRDSDRDHSDG